MSGRRLALVTGASRGLGRSIAEELARNGFFVAINFRTDVAGAKETEASIRRSEGECCLVPFDIADLEQTRTQVRALARDLGTIDVLVNNAAIGLLKPLVRVRGEELAKTVAVNVTGMYHCTQAVMKTWAGSNVGSRIINVTSSAAAAGFADSSVYCGTKAAALGFTKSLAVELGPRGVTVNAVAPGFFDTESLADFPIDLQSAREMTPLKRIGRPEEVAYLVSFLASERASFITGQIIHINGGFYRG